MICNTQILDNSPLSKGHLLTIHHSNHGIILSSISTPRRLSLLLLLNDDLPHYQSSNRRQQSTFKRSSTYNAPFQPPYHSFLDFSSSALVPSFPAQRRSATLEPSTIVHFQKIIYLQCRSLLLLNAGPFFSSMLVPSSPAQRRSATLPELEPSPLSKDHLLTVHHSNHHIILSSILTP
jgi:hypothetical protein